MSVTETIETSERLQLMALSTTVTSLDVPSLHPDYTYRYMVAAGTSIGRGPFSSSRSIKMPEDGESVIAYIYMWCAFTHQESLYLS